MRGLKYIAPILLQFLFCMACFAQGKKIDSLKQLWPTLRDTARVNCLNNLARQYLREEIQTDSCSKYADIAFREAAKIDFTLGRGEALYIKGSMESAYIGRLYPGIKYFREAKKVFESVNDKVCILRTNKQIGRALTYLCEFDSAFIYLNLAKQIAEKEGMDSYIGQVNYYISQLYLLKGDYWKAFEISSESLKIALSKKNIGNAQGARHLLASLYTSSGDYQTALHYYFEGVKFTSREQALNHPYAHIGFAYLELQQYDSAIWYSQQYIQMVKAMTADKAVHKMYIDCYPGKILACVQIARGEYDKALESLIEHMALAKEYGFYEPMLFCQSKIAKAYEGKKNIDSALFHARAVVQQAGLRGLKPLVRDGSQLLYSIFDQLGQADSALFYFKQYNSVNDSMNLEQFRVRTALYKSAGEVEQKITLLNKEKQLQEQQLMQTGRQRTLLIAGIVGLLLLGFFLIRNFALQRKNESNQRAIAENELLLQKFETEKTKAELQQQTAELEMQALRAQMNPHFIFNSLNSINRFILQNNKVSASEYLTKFSKLVRLILQNSQTSLIPLESELESLQLYLELEAVRFDHHFEFNITVDDELDTDMIRVPPLIIQPYAENAIWHGLMHKEEKGRLEIELFQQKNMLCFKITDDGIGRKKAAEIKSKSASTHKSMGMQITASRIEKMKEENHRNPKIKINDLVLPDGSAGGTEVLIIIPLYYA